MGIKKKIIIFVISVSILLIGVYFLSALIGMLSGINNYWINALYVSLPSYAVIVTALVLTIIRQRKTTNDENERVNNFIRMSNLITNGSKCSVVMNITNNEILFETSKFEDDPDFVKKIKLTNDKVSIDVFFDRYGDIYQVEKIRKLNKETLEETYKTGETEYRFVSSMTLNGNSFMSVQRVGLYYDADTDELLGIFTSRDISSSYDGFLQRMSDKREQINESLVKLMQLSNDYIIEVSLKEDKWELFKTINLETDYFTNIAKVTSYDQACEMICKRLSSPYNKMLYDLVKREYLTQNFESNKLLVNITVPIDKLCSKWQEINIFSLVVAGSKVCYILGRDVSQQMVEHMKLEETNKKLEISLRNETQYYEAIKSKSLVSFNVIIDKDLIDGDIYCNQNNSKFKMSEIAKFKTPCSYSDFHRHFVNFATPETKEQFDSKFNIEALKQAYSNGVKQIDADVDLVFPNGKTAYLRHSVLLTKDIFKNELLGLLVCTDISEDKAIEQRKRDALIDAMNSAKEASQSKTNFLSNMSHDIRTPLNAIVGMTGIAKEHINDTVKVNDALNKIEASSNHLLTLVNEVLDMSRIESGKAKLEASETDLLRFIEDLRSLSFAQAETKHINLSFIQKSIFHSNVIVDAAKLKNAIINIVNNAVKYTPAKGNVKVTVYQENSYIKGYVKTIFEVEDAGIGMSKEFQQKLFQPFERELNTTKSSIEGTGLGLSIAKSHIDLMNGSIEVESEVGKGTKFKVVVDIKVSENSPFFKSSTEIADITGLNILSVEDNFINREVISAILKDKGANVISLEDGTEFVEYMKTIEPNQIDLVLCDIQMPKMNGWDATRIVRAMDNPICKKIPILALSANAFQDDIDKSIAAGMNDHISKPVMIDDLLKKISKCL